jgi:hypothetical protein
MATPTPKAARNPMRANAADCCSFPATAEGWRDMRAEVFEMEHEWIVVHTTQGELEETQVRSFLSAHGIPAATRGEALRKTHGFTLDGLGQVEILVAPEHAADARALLAAAEQGDLTLSDEDGGGFDAD